MCTQMTNKLILILSALTFCLGASAGDRLSLGLFSSPKGFGLCSEFAGPATPKESNTICIYADLYGVLSSRSSKPGLMISYTHNYLFRRFERPSGAAISVFFGGGGSAGYVHDYERGFWRSSDRELQNSRGLVLALCGRVLTKFEFKRRISLSVGFDINAGIQARRNSQTGDAIISLYKNGLYHLLMPQVGISYKFRER